MRSTPTARSSTTRSRASASAVGRGFRRSAAATGPRGREAGLSWRRGASVAGSDGFRIVRLTPPGPPCRIQFGAKSATRAPGSAQDLYLGVSDIEAAQEALIAHGAPVVEN